MNSLAFPMVCHVFPGFLLKSSNLHYPVAHLDDIYLQGQTYDQCVRNVIDITVLFDKLGLAVHPEKSVFTPTQVLTILGFVLNSVTMTLQLTREMPLQYPPSRLLHSFFLYHSH